MMRKLAMAVLLCIHGVMFAQQEYIKTFDANITLHESGIVDVVERITVLANNKKIRHGIFRDIPTEYFYMEGVYSTRFLLKSVLLDGKPVSYRIKNLENGVRIYIGEQHIILAPGLYTFEISYQMQRVIGFFDDFDEFYWNITGNDWQFPIAFARATIMMPHETANQEISMWGYTGFVGEKARDYKATRQSDTIVIETTRQLASRQGLTVAIAVPKGIFQKPTLLQRLIDFMMDNWIHLLLLLGLIAILFTYIIGWIYHLVERRRQVVIPLFYPPDDCSAGAVRYVMQQKYDLVGLSADLVQLAVAGCITIDAGKKAGLFGSEIVYTLKKAGAQQKTAEHDIMMDILFRSGDTITINEKNQSVFDRLYRALHVQYSLAYQALFARPTRIFIITFAITAVMAFLIMLQLVKHPTGLTFLIIFLLALVHAVFYTILQGYTQKGQQYRNEIDGFSLYLKTAELDRMKLVGTPPIKTPELFETYLPYAMALGLEKEWRYQFTALFERLKAEHHPYVSPWFVASRGTFFDSSTFAAQLQSSTTIQSSGMPPGFSSGSGGRGSSGGGAGGGGGGGW